jgi:DNA-binding PadR family transcriptional regulator
MSSRPESEIEPARDTKRVLLVLLADSTGKLSIYPIERAAMMRSARVFRVLTKLERIGWLTWEWEQDNLKGHAPRRFYQLTHVGRVQALSLLGSGSESPSLFEVFEAQIAACNERHVRAREPMQRIASTMTGAGGAMIGFGVINSALGYGIAAVASFVLAVVLLIPMTVRQIQRACTHRDLARIREAARLCRVVPDEENGHV